MPKIKADNSLNMQKFYNMFDKNHPMIVKNKKEYETIIFAFIDLLKDKILLDQYLFCGGIFNLNLTRKPRNFENKRTDFGASKKAKEAVIARGGIPYKSIRNEEGRIIGNNGGESYLIYHTDDSYIKISKFYTYRGSMYHFTCWHAKFWKMTVPRVFNLQMNEYKNIGKININKLPISDLKSKRLLAHGN